MDEKYYLSEHQIFQKGDKVRVLVWRDPRLIPAEWNTMKGKFRYNKFAHSPWTKKHFTVHSSKGINYVLKGFTEQVFNNSDLQKVYKL